MTHDNKKLGLTSIALCLLYVALGLLLVLFPNRTADMICKILGIGLSLAGVFFTVSYFAARASFFRARLSAGIILLVLGLLIIFRTKDFLQIMPLIFGMLFVAESASKVQLAFDLKRTGFSRWSYPLAISAVPGVLGIILLVFPFASVIALNIYIGITLIINAVANLISTIVSSGRNPE